MGFRLEQVVPWGRRLDEYQAMFCLTDADLSRKRIASFGDGPASFNCEATQRGYHITSFDPIYRYSREQLAQRIAQVRPIVMRQMAENKENYNWDTIPDLGALERRRMGAMEQFLNDFETGKRQSRYIPHELPACVAAGDHAFDLGLSSHFLLLYPQLGLDFHIAAISEMLRVCREVRIFPICDLDAKETSLTSAVIDHFAQTYAVSCMDTAYAFQRGANRMLVIR